MVQEFHRAFKVPMLDLPEIPEADRVRLRLDLIQEEHTELVEAVARQYLPDIAQELADLIYVCYGMAEEFGLPLDEVLEEVHRANMDKLWDGYAEASEHPEMHSMRAAGNGRWAVYREDGKVLKPPGHQKPNVAKVLADYVQCFGEWD
jgi:predicted HAD superfamily Cof-like phosphohydrolase